MVLLEVKVFEIVGAELLNVILLLIVKSYPPTPEVPELLAIAVLPPVSVKSFPESVKLALLPKTPESVIELKLVPVGKLLLGLVLVVPVKIKSSVAFPVGATPPTQLAAVIRLLSAPPPFQVKLAGNAISGQKTPNRIRKVFIGILKKGYLT
jgi:hypothetical protein